MAALLRHHNDNVILELMRQLRHSYLPFSFICITFNACSDEQSSLWFSHHIVRINAFHAPNSSFQAFWRMALVLFYVVLSESRLATAVNFSAVLLMMATLFLRLLLRSWSSCEPLWYDHVWRLCTLRPVSDVFEWDACVEVCCALWTGSSCSTAVNSSLLDALTPSFVFMSLIQSKSAQNKRHQRHCDRLLGQVSK